jgi:putative component of membrane protein insertase Oxa1/YidC/SpoIIIJ protein YidD
VSPARTLLLAAIRGYKRHLSPHKGYGCPCRVRLGLPSCSTLGLRAIARYGAWRGLGVLRLRLRRCRLVREELTARPALPRPAQAGFVDCDVPCDLSCDAPHCSFRRRLRFPRSLGLLRLWRQRRVGRR